MCVAMAVVRMSVAIVGVAMADYHPDYNGRREGQEAEERVAARHHGCSRGAEVPAREKAHLNRCACVSLK
jgi:hypothetical protein